MNRLTQTVCALINMGMFGANMALHGFTGWAVWYLFMTMLCTFISYKL